MRAPTDNKSALRSLIFGGLVPVILFTVIEDQYGVLWGLLAGMALGIAEILWEWFRYRHVETMTWIGNGLILGLGAVSLATQSGIWFKLQPAMMEALFAIILAGSTLLGRPFLTWMMEKQGLMDRIRPEWRPRFRSLYRAVTIRMAIFFGLHAALATWAALHWSTQAWVLLKGIGFTGSFLIYGFLEFLWMRKSIRQNSVRAEETSAVPKTES